VITHDTKYCVDVAALNASYFLSQSRRDEYRKSSSQHRINLRIPSLACSGTMITTKDTQEVQHCHTHEALFYIRHFSNFSHCIILQYLDTLLLQCGRPMLTFRAGYLIINLQILQQYYSDNFARATHQPPSTLQLPPPPCGYS
jgi:hypothetical protein